MKLADTDAMLRRLCAQCCGCKPDECKYIDEFNKERCKVGQFIESEPTVDAKPVRIAHWVHEPDRQRHWHCSDCGYVSGVTCASFNYCPNCGAKVDRSRQDDILREYAAAVEEGRQS